MEHQNARACIAVIFAITSILSIVPSSYAHSLERRELMASPTAEQLSASDPGRLSPC